MNRFDESQKNVMRPVRITKAMDRELREVTGKVGISQSDLIRQGINLVIGQFNRSQTADSRQQTADSRTEAAQRL